MSAGRSADSPPSRPSDPVCASSAIARRTSVSSYTICIARPPSTYDGPDQHRVPDRVRDRDGFVGVGRHRAVGLRDAEPIAQRVELLAVFGRVDRRGRGTEHGNAVALEHVRELQRRLAAEAHDDAAHVARLLQTVDRR